MTAVEWFVKRLQERGVEGMGTLCGHGLDPFDYACRQAGLRLVDIRNEQTAAYMAEVHGRLTKHPSVVAVSGGVVHAKAGRVDGRAGRAVHDRSRVRCGAQADLGVAGRHRHSCADCRWGPVA